MKYKLYIADEVAYANYPIPLFFIEDNEYSILNGLRTMSGKYAREIVENLEKLKNGEINHYDFGGDDSVGVCIRGSKFRIPEYRNKCFITKAFSDYEKDIPFDEIYILMKDFLAEIEKWEKKTGKEKPGW